MLSACHARITQQCHALRDLVPHLAARGTDARAREMAAAAVQFFDVAVARHHRDEEEDLFPALIESMAGSDAVCLRELTQGLAAEHQRLDVAWERLRPALEQVAAGAPAALAADEIETLAALYRQHIECEESELLPMAARLIADSELARIGRSMQARRR